MFFSQASFFQILFVLSYVNFDSYPRRTFEPGHKKTCLMSYANNKGADQPAHPRNLISAFVVRCLDSIIYLDSIAEIPRMASFCI